MQNLSNMKIFPGAETVVSQWREEEGSYIKQKWSNYTD